MAAEPAATCQGSRDAQAAMRHSEACAANLNAGSQLSHTVPTSSSAFFFGTLVQSGAACGSGAKDPDEAQAARFHSEARAADLNGSSQLNHIVLTSSSAFFFGTLVQSGAACGIEAKDPDEAQAARFHSEARAADLNGSSESNTGSFLLAQFSAYTLPARLVRFTQALS